MEDLEWLRKEIEEVLYSAHLRGEHTATQSNVLYDDIVNKINQLDEPEVLSEEWVEEHAFGDWNEYVYADDLQNLLVPKQDEVDRAYEDGYEKGKQYATEKQSEETETVAGVFVDYLIASAKLKLVLKMEVEELEE